MNIYFGKLTSVDKKERRRPREEVRLMTVVSPNSQRWEKTINKVFKKLKIKLPYDLAIPQSCFKVFIQRK